MVDNRYPFLEHALVRLPSKELIGRVRARPLRVAFLVQEDQHWQLTLDGVFADCYRRWGGRFSLVVPCRENQIPTAYWDWLTSYDADVIYSYVPLAPEHEIEIHERLNPAVVEHHRHRDKPRLDVFGFTPNFGTAPLSSLSTIFRQARHRVSAQGRPAVSIIDSWHTEEPSRFLTDNFGTYHTSFATGMYPADASGAASLATIVAPEKFENRRLGVPRDLDVLPDEMAAFHAFAERRVTSLSLASILFAPKLDVQGNGWGDTFNLVVGDSFADRILFWNARLLIPNWLDRDLCCLRVEMEQLQDPQFVDLLVKFLNAHNHVNNGSGGQTSLTVRSCSVAQAELDALVTSLREKRCWSFAQATHVSSPDEMIPSAKALKHASEGHRLGWGFNLGPDWTDFRWVPPSAKPPTILPDHLHDAPPKQRFLGGAWATDLILEQDGPSPRFSEQNYWLLPRRWNMTGAFKFLFSQTSHALVLPPRANSRGFLTQFESIDRTITEVFVPTTEQAIFEALCVAGRGARVPNYEGPITPLSRALDLASSNEAKYLNGVFGLAGGLRKAGARFLHPFLQNLFKDLGGTPNLPEGAIDPTLARLEGRAGNAAFDLKDDNDRRTLATLIVKASGSIGKPDENVSYPELAKRWSEHRIAFWDRTGRPESDGSVDWDASEQNSLDEALIDMRDRQILFQGYRWLCPECHHRNWVDLSSLGPSRVCVVCHHQAPAPIKIDWQFRANEFLIDALRNHSVLSLIWVLNGLCDDARSSFLFRGPTKFWFENVDGPPELEADLLAAVDGKTMVCEVKSSWTSLRVSDMTKLADLARRLKADIALLAVMDDRPFPAGKRAKLDVIEAELKAEDIELSVMTLQSNPLDDDPYLQ